MNNINTMRDRTFPVLQKSFFIVGLFCLSVIILIVGKPVLAPIALSILITFILTPVVTFAESYRLPRWLSVLLAVGAVAAVFIGLTVALVGQLHELAKEIPNHAKEIQAKIEAVKGTGGELFSQVWASVEQVTGSFTMAAEDSLGEVEKTVVVQESKTPWFVSMIPAVVVPALEPLTSFLLVLVLTVFMLIRREDLRNRFLALLGKTRLSGTTKLLSDASHRLSRYLLGLLTVNFGFAVVFAIAIFLLGIPYAAVWGTVTFFFRFVPLLGSSISMCLPLLVSIAIVPGWVAPVGVVAIYLALEGITGNVIEPLLFGQSVGMNPFAILVALMFWTWAWGPLGLMLATPLSLVAVTLGRHLPCFSPLNLLFGDNRPLRPSIVLFQRLLASDLKESRAILARAKDQHGIEYAVQYVAIGAISHARHELRTGNINKNDKALVHDQAIDFAKELLDEYCETIKEAKSIAKQLDSPAPVPPKPNMSIESIASNASQAISNLAHAASTTTSNAIAAISAARDKATFHGTEETDDDSLDWQKQTDNEIMVDSRVRHAEKFDSDGTEDSEDGGRRFGSEESPASIISNEGRSTANVQEYQELSSVRKTLEPSQFEKGGESILGFSTEGDEDELCLKTLQISAGLPNLKLYSVNTEHFLRQVRKHSPSVVILSTSAPGRRNEIETICRILRRRGYAGWLLVGYWQTKSLINSSKKSMKDAGADYITHDLRRLKRMLIRSSDPFEFETLQFDREPSRG